MPGSDRSGDRASAGLAIVDGCVLSPQRNRVDQLKRRQANLELGLINITIGFEKIMISLLIFYIVENVGTDMLCCCVTVQNHNQ